MYPTEPQGGQRPKRFRYNKNQLKILVEAFEKDPYLDVTRREELARRIQIPESRIQAWFQNRRRKNFQRIRRGQAAAVAPGPHQGGFCAPHHCSGLQRLLRCDSNRTLQSCAGQFPGGTGVFTSQAISSEHSGVLSMNVASCDLETPARALGKHGSSHHSLSLGFNLAALDLLPAPLRQPFSQVGAGGIGTHLGDPRPLMAQGAWALQSWGQPPPSEGQPLGSWQLPPALEPLSQHPGAPEQSPLPLPAPAQEH